MALVRFRMFTGLLVHSLQIMEEHRSLVIYRTIEQQFNTLL